MTCTVYAEGECQVDMTVDLRLETARDDLTFPIPLDAKNITMNGSNVRTTKTASATLVDISRISSGYTGAASIRISYTLPEIVKVDPDAIKSKSDKPLKLEIPMLCGFEYPVESMSFTINMPGKVQDLDPVFTSIYRQASVASDLNILPLTGNQIIGSSKAVMNDHDAVTMTIMVPTTMFPTISTYVREGNPELVYILACAGLAMLYWLLTLRTWPLLRQRASTAPEGISAGELGCRLTLCGGDLTMMVFSWAQLGYLYISLDGNGRVLLHKRMDMGNERNQYENKVYRQLFGNRRVVDATGLPYARLCRKVAGIVPNERNMYKGTSGNMKLFRGIACGAQLFCGICVAMNMGENLVLNIVMAVILSIFGAFTGWQIQQIAYRTHLRGKTPVYVGLGCILLWILLGLLCGQVWIPLGCSLGQWLLGYFAAYGGRRSDLGRSDAGQVLGLRHYLKHLPRDQVGRLLSNDPDYFFNMAPYALAMGVINPYSRAYGRRMLDQCPYLYTRTVGKRTAEDWAILMADVADLMDAKSRRLLLESLVTIQFTPPQMPQKKIPQKQSRPNPKKRH